MWNFQGSIFIYEQEHIRRFSNLHKLILLLIFMFLSPDEHAESKVLLNEKTRGKKTGNETLCRLK